MLDVVLACLAIVVGCSVVYSVLSLAPWLPTRGADLAEIDRAIAWDGVRVFCDVGSGTGHVCRYLAQRHPGIIFRGIEVSLTLWVIAQVMNYIDKCDNVVIVRADAYRRSYDDVDILYVFGTHKTLNHRVKEMIVPQLKKDSQIVTYNFSFETWDGSHDLHHKSGHTKFIIYKK